MTSAAKGIVAIITACVIWGASSIYYKSLAHIPPVEVFAHRAVWSVVFFVIVLAIQGRLRQIAPLVRAHPVAITLAAIMISSNWFVFILAAQIDRLTEASVGYYIYPLLSVLIGRFVLGEALSPLKWAAIMLAMVAVVYLTAGLGTVPIVALSLATTFSIYGLIKKQIDGGPVLTVAAEVILIAPFALVWLLGVHFAGWQGFRVGTGGAFGANWFDTVMLILSGPVTSVPLLLFSYGAKRVTMATTGIVFYVNPTLQFFTAVVLFSEPFGMVQIIVFPMIWAAVLLYSIETLRQERSLRRAAAKLGTSGTVVM